MKLTSSKYNWLWKESSKPMSEEEGAELPPEAPVDFTPPTPAPVGKPLGASAEDEKEEGEIKDMKIKKGKNKVTINPESSIDKSIRESMDMLITEGWDGEIVVDAPAFEMYGQPELSELMVYRLIQLYKAAGYSTSDAVECVQDRYDVEIELG